jgi:penicillin-binding protein 2
MVKQKDHAFFGAFAPRDNPKIAIAIICENAGFGAESSAPIASLMIEKYLRDSVAGLERQKKVEDLAKKNLIPPMMRLAMARMDSIKQAKILLLQMQKMKEDEDTVEEEIKMDTLNDVTPKPIKSKPIKDNGKKAFTYHNAAILVDEKKNNLNKKPAKA